MSRSDEVIDSKIPKGNITTLMDVPYPRMLWDKIRKGDDVDFQELVKTGMVMVFITAYADELEKMQNHVIDWAKRNKNVYVFVDFDAEQKSLNRFLEINKNNQRIDYAGLNQLFEKICLYSSFFSEHEDVENPSLISLKTRIITFHSGKYKANYFAMSSHPDLIDEERLQQFMEQGRQRFEEMFMKRQSNEKSLEPDKEITSSKIYNISIGKIENSNLQVDTINSNQNQNINQNDLNLINDFITKLESSIVTLQSSEKEDIITQIESIKSQSKSDSPNKQTIMSGLKTIYGILQTIPNVQTTVLNITSNLEVLFKSLGIS